MIEKQIDKGTRALRNSMNGDWGFEGASGRRGGSVEVEIRWSFFPSRQLSVSVPLGAGSYRRALRMQAGFKGQGHLIKYGVDVVSCSSQK